MTQSNSPEASKSSERHENAPPSATKSTAKAADEAKAARETAEGGISKPGGFKNDPPEPTNPNEVIERHRRTLRP
jgi:hypothetical protein